MRYQAHDKCTMQKGDHDWRTYPKVSSIECNNKLKESAKVKK